MDEEKNKLLNHVNKEKLIKG